MKIYHGWYNVAAGMIVMTVVVGTILNCFGLFVLPVSQSLQLTRAEMNTALVIVSVGMALFSPLIGRILDLFSARVVMAVSALLMAASLIALGLSDNIWLSAAVLAFPMAISIVGAGTLTSTAIVARWFTVQRARAIALTVMGMSIGTVVMAPLIGWLIDARGWRQCVMILGCLLGGIILLMVLVVSERPGPNDIETSAAPSDNTAMSVAAAAAKPLAPSRILLTPQFWTISLSGALGFGALQAIVVSLVPLGRDQGLSTAEAASLLSGLGVAGVAGKLATAWLGDRIDRTLLLAGISLLIALTSATLTVADGYAALLACAVALGLAIGGITPAFLALLADRFGTASFGTASGLAAFLTPTVGAVCMRFGGEVFDATGSYRIMFLSFLATGLLSAGLVLLSRRFVAAPAAAMERAN